MSKEGHHDLFFWDQTQPKKRKKRNVYAVKRHDGSLCTQRQPGQTEPNRTHGEQEGMGGGAQDRGKGG